jgi:hypothetical protein
MYLLGTQGVLGDLLFSWGSYGRLGDLLLKSERSSGCPNYPVLKKRSSWRPCVTKGHPGAPRRSFEKISLDTTDASRMPKAPFLF